MAPHAGASVGGAGKAPGRDAWADGPGASRGSEAEAPPARTPLATLALDLPSAADQMVVLLAKARGDGMFDVIGSVSEDQDLIRRVSTTIG